MPLTNLKKDIERALEEALGTVGISKENWTKLVAIKNTRNEEMHRAEIQGILEDLKQN